MIQSECESRITFPLSLTLRDRQFYQFYCRLYKAKYGKLCTSPPPPRGHTVSYNKRRVFKSFKSNFVLTECLASTLPDSLILINMHLVVCYESAEEQGVDVNRFGRPFTNGLPLSRDVRLEIVRLARLGLRQSVIGRHLGVSHACIAKTLKRSVERLISVALSYAVFYTHSFIHRLLRQRQHTNQRKFYIVTFLSRVSTSMLTRHTDIGIRSVRPPVRPSVHLPVCHAAVLCRNGLTCHHSL